MGSGSSKEKQPQPRKVDNSKPKKPQIRDNNSNEKQPAIDTKSREFSSNTQGNTDLNRTSGYNNSKVSDNSNRGNHNSHVQNRSNSNNKNLGKFESDSESEGEDINAVLEATKNEYNRSMQERARAQPADAMYPETYAQRLQREQYKNEPKGLIRQKTIYRNPDEWEVDDNEMDSFDVSRFKQANVQNKAYTEQNSQLNNDIFSPSVPESKQTTERIDYYDDRNEYERNERKKSLPHYDTSEEALLDEIEKEFEL